MGHRREHRLGGNVDPGGGAALGIALTPDGKKLYTANGPSNDVSVVDTDKLTVLRKIPVGKIPWGSRSARRRDEAAALRAPRRAAAGGAPRCALRLPHRAAARPALRELWAASVAAKAERVACLASVVDGDTLRITRILPLDAGADSMAVSARTSLETCGPPAWQGTVHTHVALDGNRQPFARFSGSTVMLMWWQRLPGRARAPRTARPPSLYVVT